MNKDERLIEEYFKSMKESINKEKIVQVNKTDH